MVDDQTGSPTWARALAEATAEMLRRRERILGDGSVYHLAASGHTSRFELAKAIISITSELAGSPDGWARVKPTNSEHYPQPARRPRAPVLNCSKAKQVIGIGMPRWDEQLRAFLKDDYRRT